MGVKFTKDIWMGNHSIGVIVTSFNHQAYIQDALSSVLNQHMPFTEIIVVDDGSESCCLEYVSSLCKEYDITLISSENNGVASARNLGLASISTEYVVFLDDDDVLSSEFVARLSRYLAHNSADCLCFQSTSTLQELTSLNILETTIEPSRSFVHELPTYCPATSTGACAYRVSSLKESGAFDSTIWGADDFDMLVRTCLTGTVLIYPDTLLYHRLHKHNASSNLLRMSDNIGKVICKNYKNATFDHLIRLSYWYGAYGPVIFFQSTIKLLFRRDFFLVTARFLAAYFIGRTVRRLY